MSAQACFRFYAELNNFLRLGCRQRPVMRVFPPGATVKHMIEVFGVPHTEVELIFVNGASVDFEKRIEDGDRIDVYPAFAMLNVKHLIRLPARPLRGDRFIADSHLGRLARQLRMLGFDTLYHNGYDDRDIARISVNEDRIVLSRDRNLLIHKAIVRGCYLHAKTYDKQVLEVLLRLDLLKASRPFTRCMNCNGLLHETKPEDVAGRVPERSALYYEHFFECSECHQIYWEGSHTRRMRERIMHILDEARRIADKRHAQQAD